MVARSRRRQAVEGQPLRADQRRAARAEGIGRRRDDVGVLAREDDGAAVDALDVAQLAQREHARLGAARPDAKAQHGARQLIAAEPPAVVARAPRLGAASGLVSPPSSIASARRTVASSGRSRSRA